MTTHALSDSWLTDPISWDESKSIDVPFLPGVPVRILERTPIAWDERPRWAYCIWIGENAPSHSAVLIVGEGDEQLVFCSDHGGRCNCKKIALQYTEASNG